MTSHRELPETEPIVEVENVRREPGPYHYEVWLDDEIAHLRSDEVDRLVGELCDAWGVREAVREDRELVFVRSPLWTAGALRRWFARRL